MAETGEAIAWIMDSDLCDYCGALLDYADQCIECGYGWLWFEDEEYEFNGGHEMDDPYYDDDIELLD
jgi:hypothetical protein